MTARFSNRRERLRSLVAKPILLLGNDERSRNIPMNKLEFRQDSTFLYFTGCAIPGAAALIDDEGYTLFLPEPADDDALWHGVVPSLAELGKEYGATLVRPAHELKSRLRDTNPATLAVADECRNRAVGAWLGKELVFGSKHGDEALVDAVIALRRVKSDDEVAAMRQAATHSTAAHIAVMRATQPGTHERALAALFEAVLAVRNCTTGYGTILTQRGEVLHNNSHEATLEAGRLLLIDGGGEERRSGYGVDITRTYPVNGKFDPRQRAAYAAVLESQKQAIAKCTVGTPYREVHDRASLVLAQYLSDEGLIRCSPSEAVERGAHALFFPHGVGHHLGLDVHDLENFGDRPSYPPGTPRSAQFGTCYLRLSLPLEAGWVVTVEPGLYIVPAILEDATLRSRFADAIDFDAAEKWIGFGGIRIEDDILITDDGPDNLTAAVPSSIVDIEATVGSGATAESILAGG